MKTNILNLILLGFICILLYSVFVYLKEGFSEADAFGQWELLIRQSYHDDYLQSPFNGVNNGVYMTAKYDDKGDIVPYKYPNYYNPKLLSSYDFSSNYIFKIHSYNEFEDIIPNKIFTWSQGFNQNMPTHVVNRTSNFSGLEKSTGSSHIFKQGPRLFNRIVIRHPDNQRKYINLRELQVWINGVNVLTNVGLESKESGNSPPYTQGEEETLNTDMEDLEEAPGLKQDNVNNTIEFINWNTKKVVTSYWRNNSVWTPKRLQASNIVNGVLTGGLSVHSWNMAGIALYIPLTQSYLIDDIQSIVLYNRNQNCGNNACRTRITGFQIELYHNFIDLSAELVIPIGSEAQDVYRYDFPKISNYSNYSQTDSSSQIIQVTNPKEIIPVTTNSYVLGASQTYLDTNDFVGEPGTKVEKLELYLWNPRPKNKNTFNKQFDELSIQKVDMTKSKHKHVWNKTSDLSGEPSETNRYSYCFGKLRCNDNRHTPVYDMLSQTYKPYCNGDSSNNPVYCEGSILFNTGTTAKKRVPVGSLEFDLMGKYASYDDMSNSEYFNLFRGLTIPTNDTVFDPELIHNNVVFYNKDNKKEAVNICEFLDNLNLDNGTNIQTECKDTLKSTYKSCVANHGESVDAKYFNYICDPNEKCVGYECGVQFGKCTPAKL